MEVLTDPAVINEIRQHEINNRPQEPILESIQTLNEGHFQYSFGKNTPENRNSEERRLLEHPNLGTNTTDETEDWKSCSSSTTGRNEENRGTQEKSSKYLKNKRIAYACIIAAVFVLAIILAGSLTIFVLWLAVNSGSILILDQLYNTCNGLLGVSVKSLDEYNTALEIEGKQKLSLNIQIDRPYDWPTGIQLHSSNNINDIRITGPFHAKKLTGLLSSISRLEKLHLDNKDNSICTESIPTIKTLDKGTSVNITVKELVLENFDPLCTKALEIILDCIEFYNLETFRVVSGTINSENVEVFQKLLERHTRTLRKLEILDTTSKTAIFTEKQIRSFHYVHELVLETLQVDKGALIQPVRNICTIFPNVQRISYGSGIMQWNDVEYIFYCKQIKSLLLKIWVKPSNNSFSLSFLAEQFPYLESAEITLLFGTDFPSPGIVCTDQIKQIDGRKDLSKLLLANLRITSNCKLKF